MWSNKKEIEGHRGIGKDSGIRRDFVKQTKELEGNRGIWRDSGIRRDFIKQIVELKRIVKLGRIQELEEILQSKLRN